MCEKVNTLLEKVDRILPLACHIRDRIQSWGISYLECLHRHVIIYIIMNTLLHEPNDDIDVFA